MKFLLAFAAGAAASATFGTPVVKRASFVERDLATVTSAIASVSDATQKLSDTVGSFNGADQADAIKSASQDVIDAIKSGTTAVQGSEDLSQEDALSLTGPVQDLGDLVQSTVDAAKAKKQAFVDAGIGGDILDLLTQQRDAAKTFSDTVSSKVPESLQTIASGLASPINDALNDGVNSFSDQKGASSGSASGSASATGSATGSASGTDVSSASTTAGGSSDTATSAVPTVTGGAGSNGTTAAPTGGAPAQPSSFTGAAAMPTAFAEIGAVAVAAFAAVAAL